ncbi:hypothetical protein C0W80_11205 [Photobacterium leiognathi subsp. mandapamensis]|uniref:hypothetical protein n=1 Tax=Photobacterium leiognathi TaxID=553611 RepID=UPI000D16CCD9|nr:hypothetical protein [Photobacterium leiognathi]PSV01440.1 hypothetical protein C0W80_11205 [Photobacterium leiognathi subsp. mandapamensis]
MFKQIFLYLVCFLLMIFGVSIVEYHSFISLLLCVFSFILALVSTLKLEMPNDSKGFRLIVIGLFYNVFIGVLIQDEMFKGLVDVNVSEHIKLYFQLLYLLSSMCLFGSGGSLLASGVIDSNKNKQYLRINKAINDVNKIKLSIEHLSSKFVVSQCLVFAIGVMLVIQIVLTFILLLKI